ncbi:sensor histidine kinase [Rubrivivax sp. RP6-9]|uniref:sensor histidine kinase n=1 Tax=Rubrivivax sp. RP6-9 TaxID=3415750 RepID=UPI003CC609CD
MFSCGALSDAWSLAWWPDLAALPGLVPMLVLVLVLAGLHRWGVRRAAVRARLHERQRIARELHDTLLQGTQALAFELQALVERLPAASGHRTALQRAIVAAERVAAEGRDRVLGLRAGDGDARMLCAALATTARLAARPGSGASTVQVHTQCTGAPRRLQPQALQAATAIGREAIRNALRHAGAAHVTIQLDAGRDALRLRIHDDGVGLAPDAAAAAAAAGGCGLLGMAERAAELGARLTCHGLPGGGTAVVLEVPAHAAYAAQVRRRGTGPGGEAPQC